MAAFTAGFLEALSLVYGHLSLVVITYNVQPFCVMFFAWLFARYAPAIAPKELLTTQSVQIKLISFAIVFFGLALLAVG